MKLAVFLFIYAFKENVIYDLWPFSFLHQLFVCLQDRYFAVLCVWEGSTGENSLQSAELHRSTKVILAEADEHADGVLSEMLI